jgi:hypothetical protein
MAVRNQNWYDLQATRRYPLDERSTGLDDNGQVILDSILVDCHIRFPATLGTYLYVQGITVAPALVSLVFGVASALDDSSGTTIAAVTLPRTAPQNVNHEITPLQPGVAGWVALGPGLAEEFVGRYTAPLQTVISQRCARPYRPLPVPSMGKIGLAASLEGIVNITAAAPVTARHEKLTINDEQVDAIVLRLDGELPGTNNPLQFFLGPCAERPESGTCPRPPIETINGMSPDCDGNITFIVEGFDALSYNNCGGVDIISNTGLAETCDALRDPRRRRPVDECNSSESLDEDYWYNPLDQIPPDVVIDEDLEETAFTNTCVTTPLCVDFSGGTASNFVVRDGLFVFQSLLAPPICGSSEELFDEHYVYTAADFVGRNIALFRNCSSNWIFNKTIRTQLAFTSSGLRRNGGLLLNYVRGSTTTYLLAMIDNNLNKLRLLRFNGTAFIEEYSANFQTFPGTWYELAVSPTQSGSNLVLAVTASAPNGAVSPVSFTVTLSNYGNPLGLAGLYSDRSYTYFNKFLIEG